MQSCLLDRIKEATTEEKLENELGERYPLASPLANPSLRPELKQLREGEFETIAQLRRRVRGSAMRGYKNFPRASKGVQDPATPSEACGPLP